MQDPKKKQDKIEAQEVSLKALKKKREEEKPRGKFGRWLDNFWYHHKWKTIIAIFLAVVVLVCTLQMCGKKNTDVSLLLVGPYTISESEINGADLERAFSECADMEVGIVHYPVYSKEQIETLANHVDENGDPDPIVISTASNADNYNSYQTYKMTGESSVMFLDQWLFEEMKKENQSYLVDLQKRYETLPVGALISQNEDGSTACYGVRLGDTALYEKFAVRKLLPADTVIVLTAQHYTTKDSHYQRNEALFDALIGMK